MSRKLNEYSAFVDLAKGVTDSSIILNRDREILVFNRTFVKLLQIEQKDMRNVENDFCRKHIQFNICDSDCIVKKCIESGTHVRYDDVHCVTKSGEKLDLIVTATPIRNKNGEIDFVLEMHRNVTDETKIHAKYRILLDKEKQAKEELERLVELRTQELRKTNEELKQTETQLVHSEKMSSLGQMVAGLAHELNNPINFISGNVDVVQEYVDDIEKALKEIEALVAPQKELQQIVKKILDGFETDFKINDLRKIAGSIRKGSDRAADVIQGLRTFSRLDEAQLKETDIHQDIDTTLMLLRNQYTDRIRIHREYGPIGLFRCFSSQLNQVYMNLLQNAIQAIPKQGDIWIRIKKQNENVIIEIEDNGIGMSQQTLKKIFDPFFTTKPIGHGTGLGLSVSYGIIERHKGSITVESEEGRGTLFRVSIPECKNEETMT